MLQVFPGCLAVDAITPLCSHCNMLTTCAGNSEAEVDRSLVYCMKHNIADDDHTPCHKRPVFHPDLVQRWHEAYADKFPDLPSSLKLARKVCYSLLPLSCTSAESCVGQLAHSIVLVTNLCCGGPRVTAACISRSTALQLNPSCACAFTLLVLS